MNIVNLQKLVKHGDDLVSEFRRSKIAWLRHLLLLCSTVLGLLVGLQSTPLHTLLARWISALSIVLLALGIVVGAVALYGNTVLIAEKALRTHQDELQSALRENRPYEPFSLSLGVGFAVCETIFYIFSSLAVLCLVARAVITLI